MRLWNYFFSKEENEGEQKPADVVRDRLLQLVVAYEAPDLASKNINLEQFMEALKDFICQYLQLTTKEVSLVMHKRNTQSILEMSVAMPSETIE